MSLEYACGLIALVGLPDSLSIAGTTLNVEGTIQDRLSTCMIGPQLVLWSAARIRLTSRRQASCPSPAVVRAAFLRDSVTYAPGNVEGGENTAYLTVFVNGKVWAANVHGSGVPGSFSDMANLPSPDTLGEIVALEWYPGDRVPNKYRVCPGVGAFVLVTKPKGGR